MFALAEWERDELIAVAHYWLRDVTAAQMQQLVVRIYDVFDSWKHSRTDSDGFVEVEVTTVGDLAKGRGLLAPPEYTKKRFPAVEMEPWQCAGPDVLNDIDLTFKLWLDGFAPINELLLVEGYGRVFSIVGYWSVTDAAPRSLVRLNGFLTKLLMGEATNAERTAKENHASAQKHQRQMRGLPVGRVAAAEKRRAKAKLMREQAHQMAIEYRMAHPSASEAVVIRHLRTFKEFSAWGSDGTFQRAIRGSQRAALRALDKPGRR